MNNLSSCKHF